MEDRNFKSFIDTIEDLSFPEIYVKAQECYQQLEREVRSRPKKRARDYAVEKLQGQVHRFLFWMHSGMRPADLADGDWALVERVCKTLVKKKQLKESALLAFKR